MITVKLDNGTVFHADMVAQGRQFPVLHIYTHEITPIEAYQIFDDQEKIKRIEVTEEIPSSFVDTDTGERKTEIKINTRAFSGYSELYSVQKASEIAENGILIWLQRPYYEEQQFEKVEKQ